MTKIKGRGKTLTRKEFDYIKQLQSLDLKPAVVATVAKAQPQPATQTESDIIAEDIKLILDKVTGVETALNHLLMVIGDKEAETRKPRLT
jgi:hypothetical protein